MGAENKITLQGVVKTEEFYRIMEVVEFLKCRGWKLTNEGRADFSNEIEYRYKLELKTK